MAYTLPELEYSYDALEPHIDARTMEIHHSKHHATYITKANAALEGASDLAGKSVDELIADVANLPDKVKGPLRNNAGGHANHSFFWQTLSGSGGGEPSGDLAAGINDTFGGLDNFKTAFSDAGVNRFGSGWAWLVVNADGNLAVTSTPNQDSPLMKGVVDLEGTPIIGLDVWEHAYYLKYQNVRPDYIAAFWNVVNWAKAEERFKAATA
jgi:Fe-Mn family superoxide dismutase